MTDEVFACPECERPNQNTADRNASSKNVSTAILLCGFLGFFGAHRFYVGKIGTGVMQLFTCGGLGIWLVIDLMMLSCGVFTDKDGRVISNNPIRQYKQILFWGCAVIFIFILIAVWG